MKKILVALLTVFCMLGFMAAPAMAAVNDLPHSFSGNVTINGQLAPIGTVIEARGAGVRVGTEAVPVEGNPLITTEVGKYGGPDFTYAKLVVQGDIIAGAVLTFYVNGIAADQTAQWSSGADTILDLTVEIPVLPPALTIGGANNVTSNTATLNGNLSSKGNALTVYVWFEWGTAVGVYPNSTPVQNMAAPGAFFANIGGLAPSTAYYFRANADGGAAGTAVGPQQSFTTLAAPGGGTGGGTGGDTGGGTSDGGSGSGSGGGTGGGGNVAIGGFESDGDLSVDSSGKSKSKVRLSNSGPGSQCSLEVEAGTVMKGADGKPLTTLTLEDNAVDPPAPPDNAVVFSQQFGPSGATFDPPITLTMKFDSAALPKGVTAKDLVIAFWDGSKWVSLDTTLDAPNNALMAKVSHFTIFAILAKVTGTAPATTPAVQPSTTTAPATTTAVVTTPAVKPSTPPTSAAPTNTAPPVTSLPAAVIPEKNFNFALVGGIIALVAVIAVVTIMMFRRRA